MQPSDRITGVTKDGSDGWEVFYKAREMIAACQKVIELSIGEHDIRTDASIIDAMNRSAVSGNTGYAAVPGSKRLREVIANRIQTATGVVTGPQNIIVTTGGQAALFAAHMAVCDTGDRALYLDPYYATYPGTIRGVGAVDVPIQTLRENDFQPTYADMSAKAGGAKSLLVNTPNNPTGAVYDQQSIEDIARVSIENDLWLISDEVYDTQVWQGNHISPRTVPGMVERTLVVGSMSKSHAMTGFRCGWIAGPEDMIEYLIDLATSTTYGVPGFVQDAAQFALEAGPALEEKVVAPFRRRWQMSKSLLANTNSVTMLPASGAMYFMLDIRSTGLSGDQFASKLLAEKHIAVMPGESFGQSAAGHVRVAMTIDDDAFARAVGTLVEFAEGLT
jgi:arginine:pyruvate transaminase